MPDNNLDAETLRIKREGQTLSDFTKSDGWSIAKRMLIEKMNLLDSLSATVFEGKSDSEIAREQIARANSIQLIREWFADVEGTAHQHDANQEQIVTEDELIVRF